MIDIGAAETMAMMFNCGWTLEAIAKHFGVTIDEARLAIVARVKEDRKREKNDRYLSV